VRHQLEAGRNQVLQTKTTAIRFEDTVALITVEMMVMPLTRSFIASGFTGKVDRNQPPRVQQVVDSPIDGGHPEGRRCYQSREVHLLGPNGSIGGVKNALNRLSLRSMSSHHENRLTLRMNSQYHDSTVDRRHPNENTP
jgi:hypothetical protein